MRCFLCSIVPLISDIGEDSSFAIDDASEIDASLIGLPAR